MRGTEFIDKEDVIKAIRERRDRFSRIEKRMNESLEKGFTLISTEGAKVGVINGLAVLNPDVKQGYNEHSNVVLQNEFLAIKPVVRNFEANRQIFLIESSNLQKVISQLGSG